MSATPEQVRWFRRLQRCIADIPPETAVLVRHGSLEMIRQADREETFERYGTLDRCPTLEFFTVKSRTFEPAGEGI